MALSKYAQKLQDYLQMYNLLAVEYKTSVNNKVAAIGNGKGLFKDVLKELIQEEGEPYSLALTLEDDIIAPLWNQFNHYNDGTADFVLANLDAFNVNPGVSVNITTQGVTGVAEVTQITCIADVSNSLDGKYFTINSPTVEYYVWYNTSGGSAVNPSIVGKTGIEVAITTGATAAQVATATAATIDNLAAFVCPVPSTAVITVTNAVTGAATNAANVDAGISVNITTQGVTGVAEVTQITLSADVDDSLNGKYFLLNSPTVSYYVWWKTSGTIESLDPELEDKTGIKVNISTNATAAQVATATAAAIDALAAFSVPVPGAAVITVTNAVTGATVDAVGDGVVVTPGNFVMSQGDLLGFEGHSAIADNSSNTITVTWSDNTGDDNALEDDRAYAVWYNVTQDYWDFASDVADRGDETMSLSDTVMNTSDVLHVYIAFRSADGLLVSASDRIGTTVVA